jgi:hypothetical protein
VISTCSRITVAFASALLLVISVHGQQQRDPNSAATTITGRVVNESGEPIPAANVNSLAVGAQRGQHTATDFQGNFKIQGLDGGVYRIAASAPGYVINPLNTAPLNRPGDSLSLTLIKGGVIAGTVIGITGDPVVNVMVRAFQIRDVAGQRFRSPQFSQPKLTDDRGYYRIYGLAPGTYIVAAGGQGQNVGIAVISPYAKDSFVYAPASTRDTAAEIVVRSDQEATADIRYHSEPGHSVSGKISGAQIPQSTNGSVGVQLIDIDSQTMLASASATGESRAFQLNGISDGEYEIRALGGNAPFTDLFASQPRRITMKGSDVTGVELTLAPLSSIAGIVTIHADEKLNCGERRNTAMRETMVTLRRDASEEKAKDRIFDSLLFFIPSAPDLVPNDKGEINLLNLAAATYRFEVHLPGSGWFLKNLALANDQKPLTNNIARDGLVLKAGEKVSGVNVSIAEGGASLRGRVTVAEGQSVPPSLHIYLAPADRESVENVLAFFEAEVASDGSFSISDIAPGHYYVFAATIENANPNNAKSIRMDSSLRTRILREAESSKREIEFNPCQRTVDYQLPFVPPKPSTQTLGPSAHLQ